MRPRRNEGKKRGENEAKLLAAVVICPRKRETYYMVYWKCVKGKISDGSSSRKKERRVSSEVERQGMRVPGKWLYIYW